MVGGKKEKELKVTHQDCELRSSSLPGLGVKVEKGRLENERKAQVNFCEGSMICEGKKEQE